MSDRLPPAPAMPPTRRPAAVEDLAADPTANGHGVDVYRNLPQPIDWERFWAGAGDDDAGDWEVEPVLPASRQVSIYSPAKAGKSLLALELAAARATGRSVLGNKEQEAVPVVYVDLEMTEADVRERLEDLGYGADDKCLANLAYYQMPDLPPLDKPAGGAVLARIVERHQARIVVVDTMARAVTGDENDADTYRGFYQHTGRPLKAAGVTVLRLDHAGKDLARGQRGSSSKADDVDLVWQLTTEGRRLTLRRTHSRVPWVPGVVNLERTGDDDSSLSHRLLAADVWPAGTADVAADLDGLKVPLDSTARGAAAKLRTAGRGRRLEVVTAALRYRRSRP